MAIPLPTRIAKASLVSKHPERHRRVRSLPMNCVCPHLPPKVILFHGLLSMASEFGLICHPLRRAGIEVVTPTVHGYSHSSIHRSRSWSQWVEAASAIVDEHTSEGREVYVGGLCTGALVASALAAAQPRRFKGLVMLSPLMAYDGWSLPWWYRLRKLAYLLRLDQRLSIPETEPYGLKNERMRSWIRQQMAQQGVSDIGPARIPLWAVRQSEKLTAFVSTRLSGLQVPVLTLHAKEDEICSIATARRYLAAVPQPQHRLVELQNSYHLITADNDRHLVVEEIKRFLRVGAELSDDTSTKGCTP